jgi:ribonuclease P protein component
MLPRKYSLSGKKNFDAVMQKGRIFNTPYFRLRTLENGLKLSRFGIIVSNKVSKRATERNLLKRQISEIFRLNLAKIKPGIDIAITISQKMVGLTFQKIEEQLLGAMKTVKLM